MKIDRSRHLVALAIVGIVCWLIAYAVFEARVRTDALLAFRTHATLLSYSKLVVLAGSLYFAWSQRLSLFWPLSMAVIGFLSGLLMVPTVARIDQQLEAVLSDDPLFEMYDRTMTYALFVSIQVIGYWLASRVCPEDVIRHAGESKDEQNRGPL